MSSRMKLFFRRAHRLAEEINILRFEGREIPPEKTVRLCELMDLLAGYSVLDNYKKRETDDG